MPLTAADVVLALDYGELRYRSCRVLGRRHRWHRRAGAHSVEVEQLAVGAEIAAARAVGITGEEWIGWRYSRPEGDIAPMHQVRHTEYPSGRLLLHPEDADAHVFYLVVGATFDELVVVGRLRAVLGKRREYWTELEPGRPCFAVPQRVLREVVPVGPPHFEADAGWLDPRLAEVVGL